ncbi:prepilin peptidase [Clostridium swellfunianum]|uniref:prepilin peptidase n=1 Tax=Clostridium swellfunianum TaxID=1367462 RepID=UPI002030965C|nr:A24 family peptidase [Clostridium swellfunianum]MCM0650752.1 prepilin peptidase [Clostridium swellfunianum]
MFIASYVFIIGLLLGSFFNVCIYRIPREESVAFPPSHCTSCNTRLKPLDLIPVLSYIFLRGKCRYCGERISPRYAIIELTTAIIFLKLYAEYGLGFEFIKYAVLSCFLIVIGMIDYDTTDVYTKTTMSAIIIGIIFVAIGGYLGYGIKTSLLGAVLGGGVISLIILLTRGMGWGDVEICLLCGLYLGFYSTILLLFLSFVLGGAIGALLIITKVKSKKDYIPFGPFIAISAIIVMMFGNKIINWYLSFLS